MRVRVLLGLSQIVIDTDREYDEAGGAISAIETIEHRELSRTHAAAATPKRQDHGLAKIFGQPHVRADYCREREVRRAAAEHGIGRVEPARRSKPDHRSEHQESR